MLCTAWKLVYYASGALALDRLVGYACMQWLCLYVVQVVHWLYARLGGLEAWRLWLCLAMLGL